MAKSMKPGGGGRFAKMKAKMAARGAKNPGALAAYIGRQKYGKKGMAKMSAKGRHRAAEKRHGKGRRMPEPMSDQEFGVR